MKYSNPSKFFTTGFSQRLCFRLGIGSMLLLSQARAQQTAGESTKPGTLAYHLATNAAGRAEGRYAGYNDKVELVAPHSTRLTGYAEAEWSRAFWLNGVQGLS